METIRFCFTVDIETNTPHGFVPAGSFYNVKYYVR